MRYIIIPIILFLLCFQADAAIFYVDQSVADDTGDGSIGDPWKTIGKVNSYASSPGFTAGDTVRFKRGETWNDATLGTPGVNNFTFEDYGSGSKPFFDGDVTWPILIQDATISNLTIRNIDISGQDWQDAKNSNLKIEDVGGVTIDGVIGNGQINAPYGIEQIGKTAIDIRRSTGVVEIKNCTLYNWGPDDLLGGSADLIGIIIHTQTSSTVSIHDNTIYDIAADCIQAFQGTIPVSIYDNIFYNFGEQAVDIKDSDDVDIYNNEFYCEPGFSCGSKSGGGFEKAIGLGNGTCDDNLIHDNNFHDMPDSCVIRFGSNGNRSKFYNNISQDTGGGVFIAGTSVDTEVYNNLIINYDEHINPSSNDIGGIHEHNTGTGTKIYNNTIYNATGTSKLGISIIGCDASTEIKNNLVYIDVNDAAAWCLWMASGPNPTATYNLWFNNGHINRTSWDATTYNNTEQATWRGDTHTGGLFSDPLFGTGQNLQPSSPPVDAGTDLSGTLTDDYNGTIRPQLSAWDMGSLEYSYRLTPSSMSGTWALRKPTHLTIPYNMN